MTDHPSANPTSDPTQDSIKTINDKSNANQNVVKTQKNGVEFSSMMVRLGFGVGVMMIIVIISFCYWKRCRSRSQKRYYHEQTKVDPYRKDTRDLPMPPKFSSDTNNSSNFDILSSNNTVKTFEITPLKAGDGHGRISTLQEILTLAEPHQALEELEVIEAELHNEKNVQIERQYDKSPHSMTVPNFDRKTPTYGSHKSTPTAKPLSTATSKAPSKKNSLIEDDGCDHDTPQQQIDLDRGPLKYSGSNSFERKRTNTITTDISSGTRSQRSSNSYLWASDEHNKCSDTFLDDMTGIPDAC